MYFKYRIILLLFMSIWLSETNPLKESDESKFEIKNIFIFILNTARVPGVYLKNDTNLNYWDRFGGQGHLTAVGKEQIFNLGHFFKNYYSFLTETYFPKNVYVRSIDTDRSISSISSFIYGMYPDLSTDDINKHWTAESDWTPIPVHTHEFNNDPLYPVSGKICPKYEHLKDLSLQSKEYLEKEKEKKNFTLAMSDYSGLELPKYIDVWKVAENILCQIHHGFELDQISTQYLDELKEVFYYTSNFLYAETIDKAKLIAGPILNDIVKRIKSKIKGTSQNELTVYSLGNAHAQYYAMTKLLGLQPSGPASLLRPSLGNAYIFELLENNSKYFIRVKLKSNVNIASPIRLETVKMTDVKIEGCEEKCPIEKFFEITVEKIVENTDESCKFNNPDTLTTSTPNKANRLFLSKYFLVIISLINFYLK